MAIRALAFDIGGVLEFTPDRGLTTHWEQRLQLPAGEVDRRLGAVWRAGELGLCSEEEVRQSVGRLLDLNEAQVAAFIEDLWDEYLGTLNADLVAYVADLRPRYRTALLSNSFVGAREREQDRYGFEGLTDYIIYSHEVGVAKPDRRIYALTWARLGVAPTELLFVDDRAEHIAAARAVGLHGLLFTDTAQRSPRLRCASRPPNLRRCGRRGHERGSVTVPPSDGSLSAIACSGPHGIVPESMVRLSLVVSM